ncbi:MAG: putative zinc-binding metallopeptidase [Candidatus Binatia bacterium]
MAEPEQSAGEVATAEVAAPAAGGAPRPVPATQWESWSDEQLLDLRLCDLGLRIDGSELVPRIRQLRLELRAAGIRHFRPHFWLSDDWYTPDGIPGVAIPFYMAHPRLARLEFAQMLEVEGGTAEWSMRILRHEVGHALDNAYLLRRRRRRQQLFGHSSKKYPAYYTPRPHSRSFVQHLEPWYAQSHPDEDFAETFAVWLTPESPWRKRYHDWPALKKVEYVEGLMREIAPLPPRVTNRRTVDPLSRLRKTLRAHYREKRQRYGVDYPNVYDRDLRRLFSDQPEHRGHPSATQFIARARKEVRVLVARWTGEYQYTINQVIDEIAKRSRELNLRLSGSPEQAKLDFTILVAVQTMHYLHSGRHRVWL